MARLSSRHSRCCRVRPGRDKLDLVADVGADQRVSREGNLQQASGRNDPHATRAEGLLRVSANAPVGQTDGPASGGI